jgi:hypothetical protein
VESSYLIHGANALKGSITYAKGGFAYDPKSVRIYLAAACKTLSFLVEDNAAIQQIARGINSNAPQIYRAFDDFIEEFAKPDQALLAAAGMDKRMVQYLFKDLNQMQELIRRDAFTQREVSTDTLRHRIEELRYTVCGQHDSIGEGFFTLERAVNVIGGGAIIVANAAGTDIIGAPASAFSQAFGGHLVGKGLG